MPIDSTSNTSDTNRSDVIQGSSSSNVHTPSPRTLNESVSNVERTAGGYFDLPEIDRHPPVSMSEMASLGMPSPPDASTAALTALQYLPIPVLVLSAEKAVLMANDAMGHLLGIDTDDTADDAVMRLSMSETFRGQPIGQLGIDILQGGSPIWMNWEVSSNFSLIVPHTALSVGLPVLCRPLEPINACCKSIYIFN